jgi:hypothetical protein
VITLTKNAAFNTLIKVIIFSNKYICEIVSRPTQNSLATQRLYHLLGLNQNKTFPKLALLPPSVKIAYFLCLNKLVSMTGALITSFKLTLYMRSPVVPEMYDEPVPKCVSAQNF